MWDELTERAVRACVTEYQTKLETEAKERGKDVTTLPPSVRGKAALETVGKIEALFGSSREHPNLPTSGGLLTGLDEVSGALKTHYDSLKEGGHELASAAATMNMIQVGLDMVPEHDKMHSDGSILAAWADDDRYRKGGNTTPGTGVGRT